MTDHILRDWWWMAQRAEVATNAIGSIPTVMEDEEPARAVSLTLRRLADQFGTMPMPADLAIPVDIANEMVRRFARAQVLLRDIPALRPDMAEHVIGLALEVIRTGEAGPDLRPLWETAEPVRQVETYRNTVDPEVARAAALKRYHGSGPALAINSKLSNLLRDSGFKRVGATAEQAQYARDDGAGVVAYPWAHWELVRDGTSRAGKGAVALAEVLNHT